MRPGFEERSGHPTPRQDRSWQGAERLAMNRLHETVARSSTATDRYRNCDENDQSYPSERPLVRRSLRVKSQKIDPASRYVATRDLAFVTAEKATPDLGQHRVPIR